MNSRPTPSRKRFWLGCASQVRSAARKVDKNEFRADAVPLSPPPRVGTLINWAIYAFSYESTAAQPLGSASPKGPKPAPPAVGSIDCPSSVGGAGCESQKRCMDTGFGFGRS